MANETAHLKKWRSEHKKLLKTKTLENHELSLANEKLANQKEKRSELTKAHRIEIRRVLNMLTE